MFKTKQLFSRVGEKKEKYNILTFNTHERYQTQLAKTGHNFYAFTHEGSKDWYEGHAPMPDNYYVLPKNNIFSGIEFDFIFSHSKFGQLQTAKNISAQLQLPILNLEHTLPLKNWPNEHVESLRNLVGDVNVFITKYSQGEWNINASSEVIYHSIDTELFTPAWDERKPRVMTVAHDFIKRDYALNYQGWNRITQGLDRHVVGETEGLSKQSESVDALIRDYQDSLIYINPSVLSPVPTSMLEAMSCGCAIVSTATCEIPNIIENGVNGFLSNDEGELRGYLDQLLANPELAKKMGEAARETIKEKFSEQRFVTEWNNVFDKTYGVIK